MNVSVIGAGAAAVVALVAAFGASANVIEQTEQPTIPMTTPIAVTGSDGPGPDSLPVEDEQSPDDARPTTDPQPTESGQSRPTSSPADASSDRPERPETPPGALPRPTDDGGDDDDAEADDDGDDGEDDAGDGTYEDDDD